MSLTLCRNCQFLDADSRCRKNPPQVYGTPMGAKWAYPLMTEERDSCAAGLQIPVERTPEVEVPLPVGFDPTAPLPGLECGMKVTPPYSSAPEPAEPEPPKKRRGRRPKNV